jgi:hypothetical protein
MTPTAAMRAWSRSRRSSSSAATLQAFREGCFQHAACYDSTGGLWPIVEAVLTQRPSLAQRLLPWRTIRVEARLGSRSEVGLADIVSRLAEVLDARGAFIDTLRLPAQAVLRRLERAQTPSDVIRIAGECA